MASTSGSITFAGIASGIPMDDMVAKMVDAEKYQAKKLESWKAEWQVKVDVLKEINTKFSAIQDANAILKDESTFYARAANSSESSIADMAVDSSAIPGSYNLNVATGTKHIVAGKGWSDTNTTPISTDPPGAPGTFSFDDGEGNTISIDVDNTMTLTDFETALEAEISAQSSNATIQINNDNSSANEYRLEIHSGLSGTAGEITINSDDTQLSFDSASIDDIEYIDFGSSTSTITSGGTYTGSVNKRFTFKVSSGGTVGTDNVELKWNDSVENKSGTITIDNTGVYTISQGVEITIGAGDLEKNESFAIDIFNPTLQQAQDTGLAQAEKEMHSGFQDSDTTAVTNSTGEFNYFYAGNQVQTIEVAGGTTLDELVDLINKDPDNPGITASIINDGSGSADSFHLVLTGNDTGAANSISSISHTLDNMSGNAVSGGGFTETLSAANSMIKLDGYPAGDKYLQNRTNLIADVINGASISLKSTGETILTVENDIDTMMDKVKAFVDSYNEAMDYIDEVTKIVLDDEGQADTNKAGVFVGNYVITILENELRSFIGMPADGFEDGTDKYTILPQLGMTTGDGGVLELDESILREKFVEDPDAVVDLFSCDLEVVTSSVNFSHFSSTSQTESGKFVWEADFDAGGNLTGGRYREEEDSIWYSVSAEDNKYLTASEGPATGLALSISWDGASTKQTANVRIKEGKALQFYNKFAELLDDDEGIIKVLENNYENIMDNIDKRIQRELQRVKQVEARLKHKYATLETNMQGINSQMERLQAQIGSLG